MTCVHVLAGTTNLVYLKASHSPLPLRQLLASWLLVAWLCNILVSLLACQLAAFVGCLLACILTLIGKTRTHVGLLDHSSSIFRLETNLNIFGTQNMSFGKPSASNLASWATMGRSRGTWDYTKGGRGVQVCIFIAFGWIL